MFNKWVYLYTKVKSKYKYKLFNDFICTQQIKLLPLQM